jgi:hypothetical protein
MKLKEVENLVSSNKSPFATKICKDCKQAWQGRRVEKTSICPSIKCTANNVIANSNVLHCPAHGSLEKSRFISIFKCPAEGCSLSLKRQCKICADWFDTSNFSKHVRKHKNGQSKQPSSNQPATQLVNSSNSTHLSAVKTQDCPFVTMPYDQLLNDHSTQILSPNQVNLQALQAIFNSDSSELQKFLNSYKF